MSDSLYGRGLYPFVGLSTASDSPTSDSTASTWSRKPLPGQRAFETDTLDVYEFDGLTWLRIRTSDASNNPVTPIALTDALAHERNAGTINQYGVGVDESEYHPYTGGDGDGIVTSNPALFYGVYVDVVLSAADLVVRDGTTGAGTALITVPVTANTLYPFPGLKCSGGLFIDEGSVATGTLHVLYRDQ